MKNVTILFLAVLLLASMSAAYADTVKCTEPRPVACTMDYTPVCATRDDNSTATYANGCGACSNANVVSYVAGSCPPRILTAQEVTTLFSGNTYEAHIPSRGIKMTVYADPDGTMRGMQGGKQFSSRWQVNDAGEICVSYKDKMSCRLVMEEHGVYKKFKKNKQGERVVLVVYQSFENGNVHNY